MKAVDLVLNRIKLRREPSEIIFLINYQLVPWNYSTRTTLLVGCPFYTKSAHLHYLLIAQHLWESAKISPCIRKPVDKMKKATESLNITKWWRKGHLSIWYRLPCTFFYGVPIKKLSHFHSSWRNHEQWNTASIPYTFTCRSLNR